MRIAVTGTRGVPATYGGVEHQCEELYSRLARRGRDVTIYVRSHYVPRRIAAYKGISLKILPTINTKYTEAIIHTFLSCLHIIRGQYDIVHFYGQGPCVLAPLIRAFRPSMRIFFTCGGLDWKRKKWPPWASRLIHLGELLSARCTDFRIVVSRDLKHYYQASYGVDSHYIPNGVEIPKSPSPPLPAHFQLRKQGYFLFVGRLVPEKRIQDIIRAYGLAPRRSRLVIVGDTAGTDSYVRSLKELAKDNPSILFTGYQYGEALAALFANALAFTTASELEGLPLTLLEARAYGLPILCTDIPPHLEVLDREPTGGFLFPTYELERLSRQMMALESLSQEELEKIRTLSVQSVAEHFSWDSATAALERLYLRSS